MNGERSKYTQVVQHVHKNIPVYVPFLLMMKIDFTENFAFFFASYFFRFIGIIIHCGNFNLEEKKVLENKSISMWIRNITSYKLIQLFGMTNLGYIIISLIIFVLFCIRIFLYGTTIFKIKSKKDIESIRPYRFQIFMDHIVFILYPFLLEFLSFSVYILAIPNRFVIKKDISTSLNLVVCILNIILIIGYNINGIIYMTCVNRPLTDKKTPVKYRYSDKKFYLLFLMQNFIIIQSIYFYLNDTGLKIYRTIIIIFFAGVFIGLFFTSLYTFNYPTLLNNFVDIMANFCFFSIIVEVTLHFLKYDITDNGSLFFFTIIKILIAVCFQYMSNTLNINFLLKYAKTELFKKNVKKEKEKKEKKN